MSAMRHFAGALAGTPQARAQARLAGLLMAALLCCAGMPALAWAEDDSADGLAAANAGAHAALGAAEAAAAAAEIAAAEDEYGYDEGEGEGEYEDDYAPEDEGVDPEAVEGEAADDTEAAGEPEYATETAAGAGDYAAEAAEGTSPAVSAPAGKPTASSGATSVDSAEGNLVDPTQRADNSFIYDTSIGAIYGQSRLYDNRTVQVEGEVIGDRISAGEGYYWVELSSRDEDDSTNISVLISADQAAQIDRFGRYGVTGTLLQVRGTYHEACDEHEGLSDIHATDSAVLVPGEDHPDEFDLQAFFPGLITVAIGAILLLIFRFARERMR